MFLGMAFITKENLIKAQQTLIPKDAKIFNIRTILSLNMESKKYFARELKMFRAREIDFSDKIHLLDTGYIELLTKVENDLPNSCVILDDYGIGPELRKFFEIWREKGLIPIIVHGADSKYLPPMAASIIARKARNTEIEKIASDNSVVDPVTKEEIPLTQGSPSNPLTDKWLIAYRRAYPTQEFPSFVRTKWKNVKEIEEKYPRKKLEFSFQCPGCNSKFIKLYLKINSITKSSEVLCPRCGKILEKSFFKRYFTSLTIVIDTSTCISRTLSKDLSTTKYFEGATILLPSCLYEEIDRKSPDKKKGATNEIDYLRHAKENGLIDLREVDTDSLVDLTNDKKIIYVAKSHSASIMTKDTTQSLWSAISTFGFQIIQN